MAKVKLKASETKDGITYTVKKFKGNGIVTLELKQEGAEPWLKDFSRAEIDTLGIFAESEPSAPIKKKGFEFPKKYKMSNGHHCVLKSANEDSATYETIEIDNVQTVSKEVIQDLLDTNVITVIE
jgi:hypothetical protein